MDEIRCEKCGAVLAIGDHPFCPHGQASGFINRDEIPGGITLENYGPEPMTFYSHSERRAYLKAQGLQEKEKFCPYPGTDIDPSGIPNPEGYKDPYTLAAGAALIARNGGGNPGDSFNPDSVLKIGRTLPISGEGAQILVDAVRRRRVPV